MKDVKHISLTFGKNGLSFVSFDAYRACCNMSHNTGALTDGAATNAVL
jgi:hypothetical protein